VRVKKAPIAEPQTIPAKRIRASGITVRFLQPRPNFMKSLARSPFACSQGSLEPSEGSEKDNIPVPLLVKLCLLLTRGTEKAGTTRKDHPGNLAAAALTPFSATTIHFELTLKIARFAAAVHIV